MQLLMVGRGWPGITQPTSLKGGSQPARLLACCSFILLKVPLSPAIPPSLIQVAMPSGATATYSMTTTAGIFSVHLQAVGTKGTAEVVRGGLCAGPGMNPRAVRLRQRGEGDASPTQVGTSAVGPGSLGLPAAWAGMVGGLHAPFTTSACTQLATNSCGAPTVQEWVDWDQVPGCAALPMHCP